MGSCLGWAAETIKIGMIEPLSGAISYDGNSIANGGILAAEEINKKGGLLNGQMIEILKEDGQGLPAQSVAAAEKLINRDKVVALEGCLRSTATLAVQPIAEKTKTPFLTIVSSSPQLTSGGYQYFFRTCPMEEQLVDVAARILITKLGIKRVCYLGPNDEWGRVGLAAWTKLMRENGGDVVNGDLAPTTESNYQTYLTKAKSLKPDGMVVQAETLVASMIFKQAKEMGISIPFIGSGATASKKFMEMAGEASEGVYSMVPWVYTYDTPESKHFADAYAKRFPNFGTPDKYAVGGYDAIYIIAEAITKAGKADRESIQKSLRTIESNRVQGKIKFDSTGQAYPLVFIVKNTKGVPVVIGQMPTRQK